MKRHNRFYISAQDSVVTLAFAFVTLTPSCFAFATISTLFRDETECEILMEKKIEGIVSGSK